MLRDRLGHVVRALVDVRHVEDRLRGERLELARCIRSVRRHRNIAHGSPVLERLHDLLEPVPLGNELLVERARLFRNAVEPALRLVEVRGQELELDQLDVLARVDAPLRMGNRARCVGAHHVADRVRLANGGEEAVAEALALRGAANQARDVVELDRLQNDRRRANGLGYRLQPLVRNTDYRDVRVDSRKGVIPRLGATLRQRVEESGLAGIRQPDDSDLHAGSDPSTAAGCSSAGCEATKSAIRSSSVRSPTPGTKPPIRMPNAAPGQDIGGVVHPQVGARDADRGRQGVKRHSRARLDPAERRGGGHRRGRMGRGE